MSYSPDIAVAFACALALTSVFVLSALPAAFSALVRAIERHVERPSLPPSPPAATPLARGSSFSLLGYASQSPLSA